VPYAVGGVALESRLVLPEPDAANGAGLLIVPNWMGPRPYFYEMAAKWAEEGYVVMVVDMYGVDTRPENAEQAGAAAGAIYGQPEAFRARITTALERLRSREDVDRGRIAAMVFCFGGRTVIELARSGADIQGVISFHGGLAPVMESAEPAFGAELLILHGDDDPYVPEEEEAALKDELREHGAKWTFVSFSDTVHSFTNPKADDPGKADYNAETAARAWEMADEYLEIWLEGDDDDEGYAQASVTLRVDSAQFNGEALPGNGPARERAIDARLRALVAQAQDRGRTVRLTVQADPRVPFHRMRETLDLAAEAGITDVTVGTVGEAELAASAD
jgi:dienelactone hydrolase